MKKHNLILIIFFVSTFFAHSQLNFFNHTDPNQVVAIEEDGDYFWAGTNGGLYKWFKSGAGLIGKFHSQNGLPSNFVHTIKKDHFYNELWVGTDEGVAMLNVINNWTVYTTADGLADDVVKSIAIDLSGNKWFATYDGVTKYNPVNGTWTTYTTADGLPQDHVEAIDIDYQGNVWVGTWNGVGMFDGEDWTTYTTADNLVSNNITTIATDDTKGYVWVGTKQGASLYDGYNWSSFISDTTGLASDNITSIAVDAQSHVWLGTKYGVSRYDGDTTWTTYTQEPGKLASSLINIVNIDAEGNRWFGNHNGVSKLSHDETTWANYITGKGIIDNKIEAVTADTADNIWFGTQEGVSVYDRKYWVNYDRSVLANAFVYDVAVDHKNEKWIGTVSGLSHYNDTVWEKFNTDTLGVNDDITAVAVDTNNNIWCGTDSNGVFLLIDTNWTNFNTDSGLISNYVEDIAIDKNNNKWIATRGGASFFSDTGWATFSSADGLADDKVLAIAIDDTGSVWFGTNNGLTKFDGVNWTSYDMTDGLPDNVVQDIAFDRYGNVWITTEWGISRFNGDVWVNYTDHDGLAHNDAKSIYIDEDDVKWIGTIGGVSEARCEKPLVDFIADTACLPAATVLTNNSSKVDKATSYQWDINDNDTIDFTSENANFTFPEPGVYQVQLIAQNMGCVDSVTKEVVVRITPEMNIQTSDTTTFCDGDRITLSAMVTNAYPGADYEYEWSDHSTSQNMEVDSSGRYVVTVIDGVCESEPDTVEVNVLYPYQDEKICMVSVDTGTNKNLVIWHKTPDKGIASYNVYKLIGNQYSIIGNVPYDELSVYEDLSSAPEVKAARYAITTIDTCGNESDYSYYHQTIHLGVSQGLQPNEVVLDWTEYKDEGKIFDPLWYYIYRGTSPANLEIVDSLESTIGTEWNDTNSEGALYYQVSVKKPQPCDPANKLKTSAGPFSQSLSNLEDNRLKENSIISNEQNDINIYAYPNPFKYKTNIVFNIKKATIVKLEVYNPLGEKINILTNKAYEPGKHKITFTAPNAGIFYIRLKTDEKVVILKIIKT